MTTYRMTATPEVIESLARSNAEHEAERDEAVRRLAEAEILFHDETPRRPE